MNVTRVIKENQAGNCKGENRYSLVNSDDLLQPDFGIASSVYNLEINKERFELAGT